MAQIMSSELMVSASPREPGRQLRWGDAFEVRWARQGGLLNSSAGGAGGRPSAPRASAVKVCVFGKRGSGPEGDRRSPVLLKQVFEKSDRGSMTVTLPAETTARSSASSSSSGGSNSPSTKGIVSCWVVVACISSSRGTMEAGRSQDFPVLGQGDQFWQVLKPVLQQSSSNDGATGWHLSVQWMERSSRHSHQEENNKIDAVKVSLRGCAGGNLAQIWQGNTGTALLQLPENLPTCLGYKVVIESVELGSNAEHHQAFPTLRGESKAFGMPSTRIPTVTCFRCREKHGDAAVASAALAEHSSAAFDDTLSNRDGARAVMAAHQQRRRSSRSMSDPPQVLLPAKNVMGGAGGDRGHGGKRSPRSALEFDQLSSSSSEGPSTPPESESIRRVQPQPQEEHHNKYPAYRPLREQYKKEGGAVKTKEGAAKGERHQRRQSRSSNAKQRSQSSPQPSECSSLSSESSGGHKVRSVVREDYSRRQWARRKDREVSLAKAMAREGGASPSKLKSEPSINRRIASAVADGNIMNMAADDLDEVMPNAINHGQPIAVLLPEEGDLRQRFAAAIACGNVVDMSKGGDLNSIIPNMIDHNRPAVVLM